MTAQAEPKPTDPADRTSADPDAGAPAASETGPAMTDLHKPTVVNVADEAVEEEAYAAAGRIARGAPIAARLHKRMARRVAQPEPLTSDELDEPFRTCDTADYKAGVRAFLNKEKPDFRGE